MWRNLRIRTTRSVSSPRRREKVCLWDRRAPRARECVGEELAAKLYERALEQAKRFRRSYRTTRPAAFVSSSDLPASLRREWSELQACWDRYWDWCRANDQPLQPPGKNRFRMKLYFPGEVYDIKAPLSRRTGQLLDVWQHHVAGRRNFRSETLRIFRVGIMREFGDLFSPPVDGSYKALARRFSKPTTTIQSYLRRYRKLTAQRAIT